MMSVYHGLCKGGPFDGQMMAEPTARRAVLSYRFNPAEGQPTDPVLTKRGEYQWADNIWTWTPEP